MADVYDILWNEITTREGQIFLTHKGKEFTYHIKRPKSGETSGEIIIDRKAVRITRATLLLAYHGALETQQKKGCVDSPRRLGAYGDLYLYPIFLEIGICGKQIGDPVRDLAAEVAAESSAPYENDRKTRHCEKCGYTTDEDFAFCPKCGSRLI